MAIKDEMLKQIVSEIDETVAGGNQKVIVDYDKAKLVARMLTDLCMNQVPAENLTNQYIAGIKNICNNKN